MGGAAAGGAGKFAGAGLAIATDPENKRKSQSFYDPTGERQTGFDPNASNFGGDPRGRANYSANINYRRGLAEGRTANRADFTDANGQRTNALQVREKQKAVADMMTARAAGQVPSIAQMQADRQMGQAVAAQGAQAASARGAAGMALAQQGAANNIANAQGAISGQAQINAANERLQAEQAASGAWGAMRGQDLGAQAQDAGMAQFQAQQEQANRNANDARAMGYEGLDMQAYQAELQAKAQQQATLANSYNASEQTNAATAAQNTQREQTLWDRLWGSLSDERAKEPAELPGLMPGTKVLDPTSHPLDPTKPGMRDDDDFVDPGAGNIDAALKAHSDYATRYMRHPSSAAFYSDTRAKEQAILKKGQQQGIALARGASREDVDYIRAGQKTSIDGMLDDRAEQNGADHDPVATAALNRAIASQVEQDKATVARASAPRSTDPAVGLDRISRERGLIRRPAPAAANEDAARGLAPGTSDFERTSPKPQSKAPWWASIPGTILSDERAKVAERSVPVNWEENDRQDAKERHLRDPKDFKRHDTAAETKRAKRKIQDKAGKDADDLMASFKTSLDKGPSVGRLVADYDADESKDERTAYMVSDERAKRAAFEAGASYATEHITGEKMKPWDGGDDEPEAKFEPAPHPNPLPDPPPPPMKGGYRSPERYRGPSEDRFFSANPDAPAHLRPPPEAEKAIGFSAKRPAGDAIADANRSMAGSAYSYKPGLTPPDQKPGEVNVGPMAQNLEKSPVAATAVKTDAATGLKIIDKDKALKVVMSGVADLQRQQDETRRSMQRIGLSRGGRKR